MKFFIAAVYDDYISAHLAMGRLQDEHINCWLKDENTVTMITANTVGGIKLMVAEPQIERALALIANNEESGRQ
ncbi:putative signal transducing protein [Niabella ginsengisoli]|uniref:DUF2007 domain-containing protein n=1 Tax=Niabella ginsengisoli TaxID=522298 RepID=A0ABS9SNZ5_9BACT|nr:DUF2007 domain-containing protein [Niabella ginsengisoli]MCH5599991.1 DUF2007 domain-containing protein [Niabella ginsengisoli]